MVPSVPLALSKAEKLQLIEAAVNANLPHSVMRLFLLLVDNPAALLWSSARLAKALKRSERTVERAIAKLRDYGLLRTVRRGRHQTLVKVLVVGAILAMGRIGAAASRKACETLKAVSWRVIPDRLRRPIPKGFINTALHRLSSIAQSEKSDASASLLNSRLARPG